MSVSQRAIQAVELPETRRNANDRDRLREEWRLAAQDAIKADDHYQRLKEGKAIFFDELVETLIQQNEKMSGAKAERLARTSQAFKDYVRKMHDARLKAAEFKLEEENRDRIYWSQVSQEATDRKERAMTR